MVTDAGIHSATCRYSLERVKELAVRGAVGYFGREAQRDAANLGYTHADVCDCIAMLEPSNFCKSIEYPTTGVHVDVYKLSVRFQEYRDDLYIKLMLNRNCMTVLIGSFHPREI